MHDRFRLLCRPARICLVALLINLTIAANLAVAVDRKPTTPTNLRTTTVAATSVSLAWNPSVNGTVSFSYILSELNNGQTRTIPQTQTTYTWTGLEPNHTYRFVVAARDAAGNQSANSNTVTVTTPAPLPATPTNFQVTAVGMTTISLAWDVVSGATDYQVQGDGRNYFTGAQSSFVFRDLIPGTSYQFMVRAQGPSGLSPWSAQVTGITIQDSTPPSVPAISGSAVSPGVMWLTWTESFDDSARLVGYNVYVNGQPARSMLPVGSGPRTVEIHNLHAATPYEYTVKSYDPSGNFSAAAQPVLLTMPSGSDNIPPAVPGNLRLQGFGNGISSVALAWDWAADNVATMAYEVYVDNVLATEVLYDVHYPGVDTWTTVRYMQPGTTHTFTVKARDEAGNVSGPSNPLTVALLPSTDTTPPTPPLITWGTTSPGCGFIDFLFNPSSDNIDTSSQLEYEIYEDGLFRGVYRWEAFEASFGRHRFYMRALDRAGNRSAPSNEIVLDSGLVC